MVPQLSCRIHFTVRKAEVADSAVITRFNLELARETEGLTLDPAVVRRGVETVLKDASKGLYFVAEADGVVVGQVMITYEWSDWRNGNIWWLQSVYVDPPFRRKGVFRALFDHLRVRAKADPGVCTLRLYMHRDNAPARGSYASLGMTGTYYEVLELNL